MCCAHLQVRFSTKSFGLEAAQVAAEALLAVAHSLTHADMSDIIAGRPVRTQLLLTGGMQTQAGLAMLLSTQPDVFISQPNKPASQKGVLAAVGWCCCADPC